METKVFSIDGSEVRTIVLNDEVFNREVSDGSIYYAVNNELANRRVGTACTKTRAEVHYSNVKPYKQKGTGNARAGDKKSPVWVGGGTIFGPKPRDYSYTLPKKMKRLAMKSLLSLGVKEERLVVVEDFSIEGGKTRDLNQIIKNFVKDETRTILILKDDDEMMRRAAKNIPYLRVLSYNRLSAKELLYGRKLLVLEGAAKNLNDFYGDK
ncbi:MAG: 50S ribosomal protein L4 [Sphaerochaeta sp.]|jgi:large subunit ribosomal protein L4|uniref:50S ribosomal protein L4 n=1 Tax=Sphaerochaeta sp. TaxID=1972642 RepID=UPI000AAC1523|nr:50S ribosomal protein L4 [uncultured Sphaerochaeta sp.]MDD3057822.1 50S ribosomal protein L4 [Sphaerochaeta sp.]NCC14297.1 50S ribosomal protein L4 [Spirochaetia bacterium]NLK05600.1 50S ribosomal protein L4 [Spirochaetales bacterium]MDD3930349.1 50S ribosomal protein L4 [Sphaerochaeta sp.]NCC91228.1 50S ribosomal protein L4 [Spirochaetia bacterium]